MRFSSPQKRTGTWMVVLALLACSPALLLLFLVFFHFHFFRIYPYIYTPAEPLFIQQMVVVPRDGIDHF